MIHDHRGPTERRFSVIRRIPSLRFQGFLTVQGKDFTIRPLRTMTTVTPQDIRVGQLVRVTVDRCDMPVGTLARVTTIGCTAHRWSFTVEWLTRNSPIRRAYSLDLFEEDVHGFEMSDGPGSAPPIIHLRRTSAPRKPLPLQLLLPYADDHTETTL